MSGHGGVSIGRARGENRFYNPPAIRQRQQQQQQLQRQKLEQEKHQRASVVESDDCATSHSSESGRATSHSSESGREVVSEAANLDRFLEFTTPLAPAQFLPKVLEKSRKIWDKNRWLVDGDFELGSQIPQQIPQNGNLGT